MLKMTLRHVFLATILSASFYSFTQFAAVYFYVWAFHSSSPFAFTPPPRSCTEIENSLEHS